MIPSLRGICHRPRVSLATQIPRKLGITYKLLMPRTGWFVIGVVVGPFGIKGEAKVEPLTDFPERFKNGLRCWGGKRQETSTPMEIDAIRWHKGQALVKFKGVETVDDVERLRGFDLFLPDTERMELEEGAYYDDDLIGISVYTDAGVLLGTLDNIIHSGANDVYEVGRFLIPAVKEIVTEVNLETGRMTIHPIPGLLD